MNTYRAVIVGLTGIGASRPHETRGPVFGAMPPSHASAYHKHASDRSRRRMRPASGGDG